METDLNISVHVTPLTQAEAMSNEDAKMRSKWDRTTVPNEEAKKTSRMKPRCGWGRGPRMRERSCDLSHPMRPRSSLNNLCLPLGLISSVPLGKAQACHKSSTSCWIDWWLHPSPSAGVNMNCIFVFTLFCLDFVVFSMFAFVLFMYIMHSCTNRWKYSREKCKYSFQESVTQSIFRFKRLENLFAKFLCSISTKSSPFAGSLDFPCSPKRRNFCIVWLWEYILAFGDYISWKTNESDQRQNRYFKIEIT